MAHGVIDFLLYLVVPDTISHHMYWPEVVPVVKRLLPGRNGTR